MVIQMLENAQQKMVEPLIKDIVQSGSFIYTDDYNIYNRLIERGYSHKTVKHSDREFACDDDGDGFCEVHVNTIEGFWSLLRS